MPNRPNRFPGRCRNCGAEVPANGGVLVGRPGAWSVEHAAGTCPPVEATPAPVRRPDPPEGVHRYDGEVYRVRPGRQSRRLYATQMVHQSNGGRPDFQYVGRTPFRHLSDETLLTFDEAVALSAQFGFCIRCGRTLTAAMSVELGIGPVCGRALHEQERLRRRGATADDRPASERTVPRDARGRRTSDRDALARESLSVRGARQASDRVAAECDERVLRNHAPVMSELSPDEAL